MTKTTVLRVKRRRDEPAPPATFTLQPMAMSSISTENPQSTSSSKSNICKRQKAEDDENTNDALLANLLHQSTLSNQNKRSSQQLQAPPPRSTLQSGVAAAGKTQKLLEKKIVFRREASTLSTGSRKNKRKADVIHVVDARLDSIPSSSFSSSQLSSHDKEESNKNQDETTNRSSFAPNQDSQYDKLSRDSQDDHDHGSNSRQKKRKRISLQMVECRTMTEMEFRSYQQQPVTASSKNSPQEQVEHDGLNKNKNKSPKNNNSALRERMKRNALNSSSVDSTSTNRGRRRGNNRVLDPLARLIDDSLFALTSNNSHVMPSDNTTTAVAHVEDPNFNRILTHIQLIQNHALLSISKYLNWTCCGSSNGNVGGGGTILHAIALLNCAEAAKYLCTTFKDVLDLEVKDEEGCTALDIANIVGATPVAEILIAAKNGVTASNSNGSGMGLSRSSRSLKDKSNAEEREEDYVYDLYYLDCNDDESGSGDGSNMERDENLGDDSCRVQENNINSEKNENRTTNDNGHLSNEGQRDSSLFDEEKEFPQGQSMDGTANHTTRTFSESISVDSESNSRPTIEIRGGVGYWNEKGELVLETDPRSDDEGKYDPDVDDGDEDSNCEGYEGNDYPDEEDGFEEMVGRYSEGGAYNLSNSDEEDDLNEVDFRNRPVDLGDVASQRFDGYYGQGMYDDDDNDDHDYVDYDGLMHADSSQYWGNERLNADTEYAYDPDMDEE